uniref:Uncharacterized protein n=1 Tax=Daphnia galeata TaxID=27404 RepID=A0A8J2RQ79_9CRUS|nr:unnamed protein product [Daphnia galeata]
MLRKFLVRYLITVHCLLPLYLRLWSPLMPTNLHQQLTRKTYDRSHSTSVEGVNPLARTAQLVQFTFYSGPAAIANAVLAKMNIQDPTNKKK